MLQSCVNTYDSIFILVNSAQVQLYTFDDPPKKLVMSMSAAAAGSNDTIANFIAQELVFCGKTKIRLIQEYTDTTRILYGEYTETTQRLYWEYTETSLAQACILSNLSTLWYFLPSCCIWWG